MPTPRFGHSTLCTNGKIIVAGGKIKNDVQTSIVEQYDPLTNSWERLADLPLPNSFFGLIEVDKKIYAIGGFGYPDFSPIIRYDSNADQWREVGTMPETVSAFGIAVDGMKVYVVGGKAKAKSFWIGKKEK